MGNAFSGRSVRRQLGTEDIQRTNPAEIYNTFKDQIGDSKFFHSLIAFLDADSLASFACTNKSIFGRISSDNALIYKITSRPKTSTQLSSQSDATSYWSNIQQQYSSQSSARISPANMTSVASIISNEISLSYSLQQQSQKYDWYTKSGKFEDIRTLSPARISSPYNVPNSITEDDRNKLKELYENGFIQKEEMLSRLAIQH